MLKIPRRAGILTETREFILAREGVGSRETDTKVDNSWLPYIIAATSGGGAEATGASMKHDDTSVSLGAEDNLFRFKMCKAATRNQSPCLPIPNSHFKVSISFLQDRIDREMFLNGNHIYLWCRQAQQCP